MIRDLPVLLAAFLSFVLSMVMVGITYRHAQRKGIIDLPNHRSSHTVPKPRGGGIGIIASMLALGFVSLAGTPGISIVLVVLAAGGLLGLALVGWLDDVRHAAVGLRLAVHLGCALIVAVLVNAYHPLSGVVNVLWLLWWGFWTVASINIVNFMDGVDGMIGTQGAIYGLFLFALLPQGDAGALYGLVLAAACLGFLVWNWPPSKIFLGDVGSGPLGFLFVVGGAIALRRAHAALVFLPLFPLYLDALITVVRRGLNRENLFEAHRSHLYQRFANGGAGHAMATLAYGVAAAVGAFVAISVREADTTTAAAAIGAYLLTVIAAWALLHRRVAQATVASAG